MKPTRNNNPMFDEYPNAVLEAVCEAREGNVVTVQVALEKPGAQVNAVDSDRRSPLHLAVLNNRADILRVLIEVEDINMLAKDKDGFSALHTACRYGAVDCAMTLLSHSVATGQINSQDNLGRTPAMLLYIYLKCGERRMEELRLGAYVPTKDELDVRDNVKSLLLSEIMKKPEFEINMRDDLDRSVFSCAVAEDDQYWITQMLSMNKLTEKSLWSEYGQICIWEIKQRPKLHQPSRVALVVRQQLSSLTGQQVTLNTLIEKYGDDFKKAAVKKNRLKNLLRESRLEVLVDANLVKEDLLELFEDKWLHLISSCVTSGDASFLHKLKDCGLFYKLYELTPTELHHIYQLARMESSFIDLPESDQLVDVVKVLGFEGVDKDDNLYGAFHLTFPFVCATLGKLDLVGKYFELAQWHNTIPLGSFLVWILRAILQYKKFSCSREDKVIALISKIDQCITKTSEDVSRVDLKLDNQSVTKIFLSEQNLSVLGGRTVMRTAVEASCHNFLDLAFCQKHVRSTWLQYLTGSGLQEVGRNAWSFIWPVMALVPYFLLLLLSTVFSVLCIPLSFFELCCRGRKTFPKDVEDQSDRSDQYLCTLGACRRLTKLICRVRKRVYFPFLRFIYDGFVHFCFLVLLSFFVQRDLHYYYSKVEIAIYVLLAAYTLEELRQIITRISRHSSETYFNDAWNWVDWLFLIFMYTGVGLRIKPSLNATACPRTDYQCLDAEASDWYLYYARVSFVLGTILCYMKFLRIASYHQNLGPKLRMISAMIVIDLIPFMFILFVFIFAFATAFSALLYPNSRSGNNTEWQSWDDFNLTGFSLARGFIFAFYNMLGDFTMLSLTQTGCDMKTGYLGVPNEHGMKLVPFGFLVVYVILVNILLLNLLIALFGQTIAIVSDRSRLIWYRFRVDLIEDYSIHSVLPPPLNIFDMLFDLIRKIQLQLNRRFNPNIKQEKVLKKDFLERTCIASFCYIQCVSGGHLLKKTRVPAKTLNYKLDKTVVSSFKAMMKTAEKIVPDGDDKVVKTKSKKTDRERDRDRSKHTDSAILKELANLRETVSQQQAVLESSNRKLRKMRKAMKEQ